VLSENGHLFLIMNRPIRVEPHSGFRLHLVYPDGIEGMIDLSAEVGRGVFTPLADEKFFRTVHIGEYGQISWSEEIEICSDAAYAELISITSSLANA